MVLRHNGDDLENSWSPPSSHFHPPSFAFLAGSQQPAPAGSAVLQTKA